MEYDNEKTVIALSLMSMVATSYAVSLASPDQAKFNSAVKAFRVNQNGEALKIFTELYKDYPQNQQIKNNYAVVLFATGKIEQAEEVLSSVIENDKEVNIAFKNLNKIYDYAAAKAYSNALGTEKEVQPQKLQIIEALTLTGESKTPEINQEKPLQVADNSVNTKGVESKMQTVEVTKPVANPISNPVLKPEVPVSVSTPVNVPVKPTTAISKEVAPVVATTAPVAPATPVLTPEAALAIITKPIQDWVAAWSKGDLKAYLDFYTPKYSPDGDSHKSWLLGRKLRISPAKQIQVQYTDLVVVPSKSIDTIEVHFKQSYKADKYQDNTTKRMVWKKEGDKWLIHKEISQ